MYLNKLLNRNKSYTSENDTDKDYTNISDIIFKSIKYKNIGGIRLEVKGRLTKRYRADRSVFNLKWKGGLKNIDSSFKRLYLQQCIEVILNLIYFILYHTSKRRSGAFAVKGWISGK